MKLSPEDAAVLERVERGEFMVDGEGIDDFVELLVQGKVRPEDAAPGLRKVAQFIRDASTGDGGPAPRRRPRPPPTAGNELFAQTWKALGPAEKKAFLVKVKASRIAAYNWCRGATPKPTMQIRIAEAMPGLRPALWAARAPE